MKLWKRLSRGLGAVIVMTASASVWTVAAATPAQEVVDNLDNTLLATMKQGSDLSFAQRYRKLAPVIDRAFDLQRIAKLALGDSWSKLSSSQQQQYQSMFRQDTIATYASRFDSYSGQSFKIKNSGPAPGGRAQVNTVIVSGGKDIPINYVLDNSDGRWKIVNVVAKGVSDLALKRGQYTGSIRDNGPAGFISKYEKQLKKYPDIPDIAAAAQNGADGSATKTDSTSQATVSSSSATAKTAN